MPSSAPSTAPGSRPGPAPAGAAPPGRLAALVDLVLPRACAGCGRPGWVVCPDCRSRFGPARPHTPAPAPPGWPATYVSASYADAVRSILLAYKERGRGELAGQLSAALSRAVAATLRPGERALVVPIPTRRAAARARGGDHLARLVRPAIRRLRRLGVDVHHAPLLRLVGRPRDSTGLSAVARAANVRGGFRLAPGGARLLSDVRFVVLVDDVVTTGATLAEAARTLRARVHGSGVVRAAAVAATPRSGGVPMSDRTETITESEE